MADTVSSGSANSMSAVLRAQVEQSYRQLPIALLVHLVIALLLSFFLWEAVDRTTLDVWLSTILVVTAMRYVLLRAYHRGTADARAERLWATYSVLGACAAGLAWGAAGYFLFVAESLPHQMFLAFVLAGMVAGAIPLLSFLGPAFPCFVIPIVLPIAYRMMEAGDQVHIAMAPMILVFGLAMLAASAQMRRFFLESIDLRSRLASAVEAEHALEQMARVDVLTGLANRRLFEEALEREWDRARRERSDLSLIMVDIDHFKAYNDHYGHPAGDGCLATVAKTMSDALNRPGDIAARIGGEEFAVLLPDTPLKGAMRVAESIRKRVLALNLPHEAPAVDGRVTVSLGVATSHDLGIVSTRDLLCRSDRALYRAKRAGRNQLAAAEAPGEESSVPHDMSRA